MRPAATPRLRAWVLAGAGCAFLAACGESRSPISEEALRGGTYLSELDERGTVTLTDGAYRAPTVEGSTSQGQVEFLHWANGDLTGDGREDAAVVLVEQAGGSGVFYQLHAVIDEDSTVRDVARRLLGDRIAVNELRIDDGVVIVEMLIRGPGEPAPAPATVEWTGRYVFTDRGLRQITHDPPTVDRSGDTGMITGSIWQLDSFEGSSGPVVLPRWERGVPSLRFTRELGDDVRFMGQVDGTVGCNLVFGSFEADAEGGLSISRLATTLLACSKPVLDLEGRLVAALQSARSYELAPGTLTIRVAGGTLTYRSRE